MIKVLRLGDPHAKASNLEEMGRLMEFVEQTAKNYNVDRIDILGDLFHSHAILNLFVLEFWTKWLNRLTDFCAVCVLVGNHDQSGDYNSKSNALDVFKAMGNDGLEIVDLPAKYGFTGFLPYIHNKEKFIEEANSLANLGATVLVCHQTIGGSKYDNGMYAPDGADLSKISPKIIHIISGHIHSKQEFDRVKYPGTARWDTISDANQAKGITIYTHEIPTGKIISEEFISTENVCEPILVFEYREGEEIPKYPENARVTVELIGTSEWINKEKDKFKGKVGFKTKITDKSKANTRKSGKSLQEFILTHFEITTGLAKEKLLDYMKGLDLV